MKFFIQYRIMVGLDLLYYTDVETILDFPVVCLFQNVPASEVYLPGFALLILSVIHSQIVCTRNSGIFSSPNHKNRPLGTRSSRKIRLVRRSSSLSGRG